MSTTPKPAAFKHAALFGKFNASGSPDALHQVARFVRAMGLSLTLDPLTAETTGWRDLPSMPVPELARACDVAIVVGGDGTMLGVGRQLAAHDVPVVGINNGRLGFITDIALDDFESALGNILRGEFDEDRRALMHAQVLREGQVVFEAQAMNDVVVNRGSTSGMVELRVEVDGRFVANQRADGLIIATPTGSSAYALSAGGPLVHPSVAAWVMVPIAPHTLSNRPIVLPDADEVVLEMVGGKDASANFDMQSLAELRIGDRVHVRRAQHKVRFLHPRDWSYFDTLRKKLHWNS
jgi:NAD+ kinase